MEFHLRKVKKHSLLKNDFFVSKTNYAVRVCTKPSCTCQNNRKHGESVFCKHINLKILDVTNESILRNTYIEKAELVSMCSNASIMNPENLYFFQFCLTLIYNVHLKINDKCINNMLRY